MVNSKETRLIQWVLTLGVAATSIYITPNFSSDPINMPKMFLLVITGFFLFGFALNNLRVLLSRERLAFSLIAIFIIDMGITLIFSGAPYSQQLFGVTGRNTGILSYLSLAFVLVAALIVSDFKLLQNFSKILLFCGAISTFYGLLQSFGHDPIKWNNPYSSVISFLGNPDFASSFIALSSALCFGYICSKDSKIHFKLGLVVYLFVAFYAIIKSHAQQGVLVLTLIGAVTFYIWLLKSQRFSRIWSQLFACLSLIVAAIAILGIFKIGPLANVLYKVSVRQRGFYWHAALEMMKSKPFSGVGMDSYGDWYLQKRSANAAFFSLPTQSNAAHNVYLDLAANGGIPLLIISLLLTLLTFFKSVKSLKKMEKFDPYFTAIFTAWLGYQAQSIVSINQLGIAVWGWALSGILLGYAGIVSNQNAVNEAKARLNTKRRQVTKIQWALPLVSLIVGILVAFPPYISDHAFRTASSTRDGNKVLESVKKFPESTGRTLQAASLFASSKLYPQALELAKHVSDVNPREYNAWTMISQLTPANSKEHLIAVKKMKQLNPFDNSIK